MLLLSDRDHGPEGMDPDGVIEVSILLISFFLQACAET